MHPIIKKLESKQIKPEWPLEIDTPGFDCINAIMALDEEGVSLSSLMKNAAVIIQKACQCNGKIAASITFHDKAVFSRSRNECDWNILCKSGIGDHKNLQIKILYPAQEFPGYNFPVTPSDIQNWLDLAANALLLVIEKKQALQSLTRKRVQLHKAYKMAQIGTWEVDLQSQTVIWSSYIKEMHEVDEDFQPDLQTHISFFNNEIDRNRVELAITRAIQNNEPFEFETQILTAKGNECWVRVLGEAEMANGKCVRIVGTSQNIQQRKQAEKEILLREHRLRSLVQGGSDLIVIMDIHGNFTYVSPTSKKVLGLTAESLVGTNAFDSVHENDKERLIDILKRLPVNKQTRVSPYRYLDSDGNWKWLETTLTNHTDDPAICGYIANSRDITNDIKREEKLRQLSLVASKTTDVVVIMDPQGRITWVNEAFENATEYSHEEVIGKNMGSLIQGPDTDLHTVAKLDKALQEQKSVTAEILNYTKSGKKYWMDVTVDPVFDEKGKCTHFIEIKKDISTQKKEEERLRLLESVITNTSEAVVISEARSENGPFRKILFVNEAYTKMTGYSGKEIIGNTAEMLHGPDTNKKELERLKQSLDEWKPVKVELLYYRKSGEPFWVHISVVPVTNKKGEYTHWISIERDVTDRKHQQQKLVESLEEKDILLSEIHHRVKNNLAVISGMMQLQAESEDDETLNIKLFDSMSRIKTIANIHEQIYQSESFSKINMQQNIKRLISNLFVTFQPETEIEVIYNCIFVELNINQAIPCSLIFNEIITNTLKHAFQGREEGTIVIRLAEDNGHILFQIEDDGVGMPKNPDISKSDSLGLQIINVLSKQLKGRSSFDNPNGGCRFNLEFKKTDSEEIGDFSN